MTGEGVMTREAIRAAASAVAREVGVPVSTEEPLAPYLSMRVGGPVPALLRPRTPEDVSRVVVALRRDGVPHRLLGGGSNLVAADSGLDFAVVHVGSSAAAARWDGPAVRAPGGLALGSLLRDALQRGLTGLEWAAGLPGSVGGAVFGNAGAFGGEIGGLVREVVLMSADGSLRVHAPAAADFAYRSSFLRPGEVVLEVVLELKPGDPAAVRAETDRVNRTRAASQPKGGHSSGCIFKNPAGSAAGRLVDECGLKGLRRGGAFVSPAHGNFIVNDGTATGSDVLGLIEEVRQQVRQRCGVELELEVKVWGEAP